MPDPTAYYVIDESPAPALRPNSMSQDHLLRACELHNVPAWPAQSGRVFADAMNPNDPDETVELTGYTRSELLSWLGY